MNDISIKMCQQEGESESCPICERRIKMLVKNAPVLHVRNKAICNQCAEAGNPDLYAVYIFLKKHLLDWNQRQVELANQELEAFLSPD